MSEAIARELMAQRFRSYLPVVIDLETGGFNAQTDAVLEIAAVTLTMDPDGNLLPEGSCIRKILAGTSRHHRSPPAGRRRIWNRCILQ